MRLLLLVAREEYEDEEEEAAAAGLVEYVKRVGLRSAVGCNAGGRGGGDIHVTSTTCPSIHYDGHAAPSTAARIRTHLHTPAAAAQR